MHYSSSTKFLQTFLNNNKNPQQTFWQLSKRFGQQRFAKGGERQNAASLLAILAQPCGLSLSRSSGDTWEIQRVLGRTGLWWSSPATDENCTVTELCNKTGRLKQTTGRRPRGGEQSQSSGSILNWLLTWTPWSTHLSIFPPFYQTAQPLGDWEL